MIALQLRVIAQGIEVISSQDLVSGSVDIYTAEFEFNDAWSGFAKTALFDFVGQGEPTEIVLTDNSCVMPHEPLENFGYLRVGVCGVNGTQVMPTVWTELLQIKEGAVAGSIHIEPTGTTYEQVMAILAGIDGGTGGQILAKQSDVDYDFKWVDNPAQYVPGTEGDVVIIGSNNNISDSGVSKDNLILAPQLASNNYKTDSIPYIYRQTGGGIGTGNREYDEIVGGSIVNNQAVKALSNDDWVNESGVTVTYGTSNDATVSSTSRSNGIHTRYSVTSVVNHIYYLVAYLYSANTYNNICFGRASSTGVFANNWSTVANTWKLNNSLRRASSASSSPIYFYSTNTGGYQDVKVKDPMLIDLTEMLGPTVAEYIFANGRYDILRNQMLGLNTYFPYTATPSLESVSGLSSHQMKDGNGNVIAEYPLDSSLTLRGVAILDDNNNIKFDGDEYAPDGTVIRKYGIRAYQSGDESLANAITDMTNTVYKLTTPTTETAEPYESLQICDPLGTEEYVTTGIVPVGHETRYPENQVAKLDGLPSDFSRIIAPTEKAYKATRTYTVGRLLIVNNILYKVISAISSGATLTVGTNISETTLDEVIASL